MGRAGPDCIEAVKGVRIDYRIRSDNAWLTIAYTHSRRANGEQERYSLVGGLTLNTDDIIQIMSAIGAGWGDSLQRDPTRVTEDIKNGCITREQANRDYRLNTGSELPKP